MSRIFVVATVRENVCDEKSAIASLVLDRSYENYQVHMIEGLKDLAEAGLLYTQPMDGHSSARVRIFYSAYYARWIATTRSDNLQCNNLLMLPIYYPQSKQGTTTYFDICSL